MEPSFRRPRPRPHECKDVNFTAGTVERTGCAVGRVAVHYQRAHTNTITWCAGGDWEYPQTRGQNLTRLGGQDARHGGWASADLQGGALRVRRCIWRTASMWTPMWPSRRSSWTTPISTWCPPQRLCVLQDRVRDLCLFPACCVAGAKLK